jgi:hypothetical protein
MYIRSLGLPKSDRKLWPNATFRFSRTTLNRPGLESSIKITRDHHELGFQRDSGCRRVDPAQAALDERATTVLRAGGSSASVAGRARGGCRRRGDHAGTCCRCWSHPHAPDLAVPRGAMWLQRLRDGGTNTCGWADLTWADHDDDGRHAQRGSGGIQRGWDAALTDMRARGSSGIKHGRGAAHGSGRRGGAVPAWTEWVRGGRTTSSRLAEGRTPSQATHLRWDRWRRTSLGASCDDGLP